MPIRIIHVVSNMNVGGIETMLMNLYRNINRDKIQFDFIENTKDESYYDKEITELGGIVFKHISLRLFSIFHYIFGLSKLIKNLENPLIIHSHISINSLLVLLIAKYNGIPTRIAHSHESHKSIREHRIFRRPLIFILKKFINVPVTHRFACSIEAGKWLFGNKDDIYVLKNSIMAENYVYSNIIRNTKRTDLNCENKFIIGHIGNFTKAKNYPFIIEVFKEIQSKLHNSELILVGNSSNNPEVERMVKEFGLERNVKFLGIRSDVHEILQVMDVLLFPSLFEGLPVTLIEAQANGLKCIVSDTITKEVDITGLVEFIPLSKPASYWAEQVLKYADGYERKDTYAAICAAGYDIKDNAKWLENFYLNLHSEANRGK